MSLASERPIQPSLLVAASQYAAAGYAVFPLHPGTKTPRTRNGMKDATTDVAQIRGWWTDTANTPNASQSPIACRVPEAMVILDIDPRHGGDATWDLLCRLNSPPDIGRAHRSGRGDGGRHLWFVRPEGPLTSRSLDAFARIHGTGHAIPETNKHSSGIDILHYGHRYTILPPSAHADSGLPYEWLAEGEPDPMPGWLVEILTTIPEHAPPPPRPASPPRLHVVGDRGDDDLIGWFNDQTSWVETLGGAGWALVAGDGDSDGSAWRHPNASAAKSATIRGGRLYVYSPNTPFETTETSDPQGQSLFDAYAELDHGGDVRAAMRGALGIRNGTGSGSFERRALEGEIGFSGPNEPGGEGAATGAVADPEEEAPWPAPTPLLGGHTSAPFPIDVMPRWVAEHAQMTAANLQVAIELPAVMGLAAIAVAALGKAIVWYDRTNHPQPCQIYTAVVAPPSSGKSPATGAMFGALYDWERERIADGKVALGEHASELRSLEKRLGELETSIARDRYGAAPDLRYERSEAIRAIAALEAPPSGAFIADDATTEALGMMLAETGGRVASIASEGGIFDRLAGQYSDGVANLDLWLGGWSGEAYKVIRTKRAAIDLPAAHLVVAVAIQPDTLDAVGCNKLFNGRGLVSRFLIAMPPSNVGFRDRLRRSEDPAPAADRYRRDLIRLAEGLTAAPARLRVEGEASDVYAEWDQRREWEMGPDGPFAHIQEWLGKLRAGCLRIAALLHLAHGGMPTASISVDTIRDALRLCDWFLGEFLNVMARWGEDDRVAKAAKILEWARRKDLAVFTVRDVYNGNRTAFPDAESVEGPLEVLIETGWLRARGKAGPSGRGKRSTELVVHPDNFAAKGSDRRPWSADVDLSGCGDGAPGVPAAVASRASSPSSPAEEPRFTPPTLPDDPPAPPPFAAFDDEDLF